jgi:TonB family protein
MHRCACFLLLGLSLSYIPPAHAESVKGALNHYKKQVLALRAPLTPGDQVFDSSGHPASARPEGPWLLYGGIYVQKIGISSNALLLEGPRVGFTSADLSSFISMGKPVRVEIHLDQPLKSADEAQALLDRVFFLEGDSRERAKSELRRSDDSTADEPIYQVNKGDTKPPRATYTPAPDFSEKARRTKHQGTVLLRIVIDKAGNVTRVRLEHALGDGLDENAMERVKDWRFIPGTHNGEHAAVEMNVIQLVVEPPLTILQPLVEPLDRNQSRQTIQRAARGETKSSAAWRSCDVPAAPP